MIRDARPEAGRTNLTLSGRNVGIAILDRPGNFRYPTVWHVRACGLMTANPFGISCFTNDKT